MEWNWDCDQEVLDNRPPVTNGKGDGLIYVVSEFIDYDSSRVEGLFSRIEDAEEWVLDHAKTWDSKFQRKTFEGTISFHSQSHGVGYLIEPFEVDSMITKKQKKTAKRRWESGEHS